MSLEEVIARYKAALPDGIFFHFPMTGADSLLEHTGVCAWTDIYLPGPLGGGDGYGLSDAEAEVGTLGELHERLQSLWVVPTLEREEGSFNDLKEAYGAETVADPVTLGLPADSDYHPNMKRFWVKIQRYPEGAKWVPLEGAASSSAELPEGYEPLFLPVSNGLGAGLEGARGLCHGVLEILQRDGNSVDYRALDQGRMLDLTGKNKSGEIPKNIKEILERLEAAGLTVNVKLAATDFGLVNLYVNGYGPDDDAPQIKLAAGGEACDLDRSAALRKALLEFAFSRARLAFSHGPLEEVRAVSPEGYLAAHFEHAKDSSPEPRALEAMLRWLDLSPAELKKELGLIYAEHERISFADLPSRPDLASASPEVRLQEVAKRLEDFEILYLDMATPRAREQGVRAVKVIIPGLEVETVSYGRIGERNLRRLLERESPFVGLGAPPSGAQKVHLTEEAEAHLGGPAWFHLGRLEQHVGPLYALYREPARHMARYVKEGWR